MSINSEKAQVQIVCDRCQHTSLSVPLFKPTSRPSWWLHIALGIIAHAINQQRD